MLSIFKSKKEEAFSSEIYYKFYRKLQDALDDYKPDEDELDVDYTLKLSASYSDFSNDVLCDGLNELHVVYCPNISCMAEKETKYIDDYGDEVTSSDFFWPLRMQICVVGNEIRCYLLQREKDDDEDYVERLAEQLDLKRNELVWFGNNLRHLYVTQEQDFFVLDYFDNIVVCDDGSYTIGNIDYIVEKIATLGNRILRFAEDEGYFD